LEAIAPATIYFSYARTLHRRLKSAIRDCRPRPSLYAEARNGDGSLTFARGLARSATIGDVTVFDLAQAKTLRLADAGNLYSPRWLALMGSGTDAPS